MDNFYHTLVYSALLAPLASFTTVCLLPQRRDNAVSVVSLLCATIAFLSAAILLVVFWNEQPAVITLQWFTVGNITFSADLALSNRSLLMLSVVSFISLLVHLYSTAYMKGDTSWKRYFAMLGFFTFSMQGIVLSDNLLFLFIFWELVGFSSYMLIGHWSDRPEAGKAASKAFIMNRIGDAGFLVGLMIIWTVYGSFSLSEIFTLPADPSWQTAGALCIFCGIVGKSAQFPLFTWLPDAMEGPTPVSALIHAATMVAAGVYLLVRVFSLFTPEALIVVAITGMITTLIGALAALSQYDIKKILAYSTMSQLGLMVLALGMGVVDAALLHLLTHAFFKACLFLSAGMIIHSIHEGRPAHIHFNDQDIRNMGGLRKRMPVTFLAFMISSASLAGVPFFSGFLSKEAILTTLFMHTDALSWAMIAVILVVSFLTVLYTFRMIWFVFYGRERTTRALEISEPGWIMRGPAILLAVGSLWFLVSWNPFDFKGWILPAEQPSAYALWITIFSIAWVMVALLVSWYVFRNARFKTNHLFRNVFHIDRAFESLSTRFLRTTSHIVEYTERRIIDRSLHGLVYGQVIFAHFTGWIDRVFIDGTVNAAAKFTGFGGRITRSFQGGNIQLYIFWSAFTIIIFIIWALK